MDFRWLGPYKIVQALGRGLYRIEGLHDADVIPRIHGVHLKKYSKLRLTSLWDM